MGSIVGGVLGLAGGLIGGRSAERAAQASAAAQLEAGRLAAEEARFRPVGITTRFGRSTFDYGPEGRVTGAGYEISPELRAYQDRLMGLTGRGLTAAEEAQALYAPMMGAGQRLFTAGQGYLETPADQRLGGLASRYLEAAGDYGIGAGGRTLTGLGTQYITKSPAEAEQEFMARQQELLAPSREREFARLQNRLFQTGREGLAVGATGVRPSGAAGLGATTPEMEAYYNAIAQQDAELAARAAAAGREQAQFGAGLLRTGAGLIGAEEELGRAGYGFGADLLARQLGLEREQLRFGAGLFGTGADLLSSAYRGQIGALAPFETYLGQAKGLEALAQQPLDVGINIGAKGMSPTSAQAILAGGTGAAEALNRANAYNPFATALTMASRNPALMGALGGGFDRAQAAFSGTGLGSSGFGTGLAYGNQDYGLFI